MFNKKTIKDLDVAQKRVLVRVDFNVPILEGEITDDTRIKAAIPTIQYLLDHRASLILCSHLGRPKGMVNMQYTLRPVAEHLGKLMNRSIKFAEDCISQAAQDEAGSLQAREILMLENTRFHAGETKNDPEMARTLARMADLFVNDAFGSAHRAHASTAGVADFLPSVAGFLLEKEIRYLGQAIESPDYPFVAILGGAKVSDKIGVIRNLLGKADHILIGGGMANTFLNAQGFNTADSLVEKEVLDIALTLLQQGKDKIVLPDDYVIADQFDKNAKTKTIPLGHVDKGWRILDIGPVTVKKFSGHITKAATIVWNGPMGVFEFPQFAHGTFEIAKAVSQSSGISIIGGGESVAAINQSGLADKITHISTGGGASLEMLEGKILPGVAALSDK